MKKGKMARKGLYIGAGAGLAVFAVAGLLPGSFIGGLLGLNIAGSLLGSPVGDSLLPRMIVGVSMLLGAIMSGAIFVTGSSLIGRLAGTAIDMAREGRTVNTRPVVKSN